MIRHFDVGVPASVGAYTAQARRIQCSHQETVVQRAPPTGSQSKLVSISFSTGASHHHGGLVGFFRLSSFFFTLFKRRLSSNARGAAFAVKSLRVLQKKTPFQLFSPTDQVARQRYTDRLPSVWRGSSAHECACSGNTRK